MKSEIHVRPFSMRPTVGSHALLNDLKSFAVTAQSLIVDAGNRTALVAGNLHSGRNAALLEGLLNLRHELLGVDGSEVEIKYTFDSDSQTEDKAQQHRRHPACTALEEFLLDGLVHRSTLDFGFGVDAHHLGLYLGCHLLRSFSFGRLGFCLLSVNIHSRKAHNAYRCQNQKKFFHSFNLELIRLIVFIVSQIKALPFRAGRSDRTASQSKKHCPPLRKKRAGRTAEKAGFEPTIPFWGIRTFQARTFSHSVISPFLQIKSRFSII